MCKASVFWIVLGLLAGAGSAQAKGPFDGLEMDVIGADELPKGPTARIALPRAGARSELLEDSVRDSASKRGAESPGERDGLSRSGVAAEMPSIAAPSSAETTAPASEAVTPVPVEPVHESVAPTETK
jgi:hypothetical protein